MTVRALIPPTDPTLRQKATPVVAGAPINLLTLKTDMVHTLQHHSALGLAGPQIGVSYRVIVVKLTNDELLFMVNPTIIKSQKGVVSANEGCLSLPGMKCDVPRFDMIKVSWEDELGVHHSMKFRGIESFCVQHEIDHLDGVLMVDY